MARWLTTPVTPRWFDAAFGLVGGGGCAVIAVVNAVMGYWRLAGMFAVIAAGPLWHALRWFRSPEAAPGTSSADG